MNVDEQFKKGKYKPKSLSDDVWLILAQPPTKSKKYMNFNLQFLLLFLSL